MKLNVEALRILLEIAYYRFYRFSDGGRQNLLDLLADILNPLIEAETMGGPDTALIGDWLRRFMFGYWRKSDGHYIYTVPHPSRMELVLQFLEERGLVIPFLVAAHQGDEEDAQTIRRKHGYNYADARLLAGVFRGLFYGETLNENEGVKASFAVYLIPGERMFRVRFLRGVFEPGDTESVSAFAKRFQLQNPDRLHSSEMFGSLGTDFGIIYDGCTALNASEFMFISKGRRISKFTLRDKTTDIEFSLCRQPEAIDAALSLLRRADSFELKSSYTPSPDIQAAE